MAASSNSRKRVAGTPSARRKVVAPAGRDTKTSTGPAVAGAEVTRDMRAQALADIRLPRAGAGGGKGRVIRAGEDRTPAIKADHAPGNETASRTTDRPEPVPALGWRRLHEMPVGRWTAPVRRLLGLPETSGNVPVTAEAMADVQAAVMNELAQLNQQRAQGQGPVQGQPFGGMPGFAARGADSKGNRHRPRQSLWWLLGAVAVLVGILLVGYRLRPEPGPGQALQGIAHSLMRRDAVAFARHVDVETLSRSIVAQLQALPPEAGMAVWTAQLATLPAGARAIMAPEMPAARRDLRAHLHGDPAARLAAELKLAVARGDFAAMQPGLLHDLWRLAGARSLQVSAPQIRVSDTKRATAQMMLDRTDTRQQVPVTLVLNQLGDGWQLTDMPDVISGINQLAQSGAVPAGRDVSPAVVAGAQNAVSVTVPVTEPVRALVDPAMVEVRRIRKAPMGRRQMQVRAQLHNRGKVPVADMKVQIVFADAAGQPMKVVMVQAEEALPAGAMRTYEWVVPVQTGRSLERYVRDLPLSALTARGRVLTAHAAE